MPSSLSNFYVNDHIIVSYSDDDNEDENPLPHAHIIPVGSIEHEFTLAPPFSRWVHTTREETNDFFGDPIYQRHTIS
jgi:hypothetical protein